MEGIDGSYVGVGVGGRRRDMVRGMSLLVAVGGGGRFERGGEEEEKKEVQIVIKFGKN